VVVLYHIHPDNMTTMLMYCPRGYPGVGGVRIMCITPPLLLHKITDFQNIFKINYRK